MLFKVSEISISRWAGFSEENTNYQAAIATLGRVSPELKRSTNSGSNFSLNFSKNLLYFFIYFQQFSGQLCFSQHSTSCLKTSSKNIL